MRRNIVVYAAYLLIAMIVTFPLILHLSDQLAGFEYSDAREMAHHLWWFGEALRTGENPFFMSNLAYPNGIDAITLWANPLQFFPAWVLALILPLPMAANVTILGMMALNGWGMWFFMKGSNELRVMSNEEGQVHNSLLVTRYSSLAAFIAGIVFMLFPTMQGHLGAGHAGLLIQFPVPLYALALMRLRKTSPPDPLSESERGSLRAFLIAALWFVVSGWGHTLQILYVTLPLTAILMLPPLFRRDWRTLGRMIGAVFIGMVALLLYLLPTFREAFSSTYTDEGGVVRYSADLLSAVSPSFFHPVWGRILEYPRRVLGVNLDEGAAYIGVIAGILALIGVIRVKRARIWLLFAALAYLLSLGALLKVFDQPITLETDGYLSFVTLPFALVSDLPGVNLMRAPGRFNFGLAFAVAVMAGYGVSAIFSPQRILPQRRRETEKENISRSSLRLRVSAVSVFVLCVFIIVDYQTFFPLPTIPAAIPPAIHDLASRTDIRAVFGVPYDNLVAAKADLYYQTAHRQSLIAGQVTRRTPVDSAMLNILQATLDPSLLDQEGADIVVVHHGFDDGALFTRASENLGEPFYNDNDIALFDVPMPTQPRPFAFVAPEGRLVIYQDLTMNLYAQSSGWAEISGSMGVGFHAQMYSVLLDGVDINWITIDDQDNFSQPIHLEAGYHTLTLSTGNACADHVLSIGYMCNYGLFYQSNAIFSDDSNFAPSHNAKFGRGVTLAHWHLQHQGDTLSAWLDWQFAEPITTNDIRFVHLIDESGTIIAQSDIPLADVAAGTRRVEAVDLTLPADLPAGRYTVYTGWYTYPDIVRFPLLSAPENALARQADNLLILGTFDAPP